MRRAALVFPTLALLALLGGCATTAPRTAPEGAATIPPPAVEPTVEQPAAPVEPPSPPVQAPAPPSQKSVWERLRDGYRFAECDAGAKATRWQRIYTRSPSWFAGSMDRSLPSLEFVLAQLEQRGLPTEFALLPIIESWYLPVKSKGNRPAGIWQIMPVTGRHLGLEISADYDGRLDLAASTRAAMQLIEHLADVFRRDWRLVNMGYNAGEFRVRRALPRAVRKDGTVNYGRLPVSRITHEHLAKLQAVACILREPGRFEVLLPSMEPGRRLVAAPLDSALDVELAAQLAAMPVAEFRSLNPAALGPTLRARHEVILPANKAEAFGKLLARLPESQRTGWRRSSLATPVAWTTLAHGSGPDAETLAAIHHTGESSSQASGSVLLRGPAPARPSTAAAAAKPPEGRYAVLAGDSLWRIAKRFGVGLEALLGWNRLKAADVLVPGQLLWVSEPRLD